MMVLNFDRPTIVEIAKSYFNNNEIADIFFRQIVPNCRLQLNDEEFTKSLNEPNPLLGDLTGPPDPLNIFYLRGDLAFGKFFRKLAQQTSDIIQNWNAVYFRWEETSAVYEFDTEKIKVNGRNWEDSLSLFTFKDNYTLDKTMLIGVNNNNPSNISSFNDLPKRFPPAVDIIYIDRFAIEHRDKPLVLKSNFVRYVNRQTQNTTETINIIVFCGIPAKRQNEPYISPEEAQIQLHTTLEQLLTESLNVDFKLLVILDKRLDTDSRASHDRFILSNYYHLKLGDTFSFFYNDELDRRAGVSEIQFRSHLKGDWFDIRSTMIDWIQEKINRNVDLTYIGEKVSRLLKFQ
jgi:hypothetical protein